MLIASAIVSRDGFCCDAHGALPPVPWSRALGDESLATLDRCSGLLYGRVTFERDRAFWTRPAIADAISAPWQWRPGWTYTDEVKL